MSSFAPASKKAKTSGKDGLDGDHFQGKVMRARKISMFGRQTVM